MFVRFLTATFVLALAVSILARSSLGGGHAQVYRVKPYDTLWSIAVSHYAGDPRAAVWRIERRNHLDGATISPGERLVLP